MIQLIRIHSLSQSSSGEESPPRNEGLSYIRTSVWSATSFLNFSSPFAVASNANILNPRVTTPSVEAAHASFDLVFKTKLGAIFATFFTLL